VEDIYKEEYNESLPCNWLANLNDFTSNIIIEELPNQNKSILCYAPIVCIDINLYLITTISSNNYRFFHLFYIKGESKNNEELMNTSIIETCNLPLMKFEEKTEKNVQVICIDSNHSFWICFVNDSRNVLICHFVKIKFINQNNSKN